MDNKLTASLEDLEQHFNARMMEYESRLKSASSVAQPAASPDITALTSEFAEFRMFVWKALSKFKAQIEMLSLGFDRHETLMRRKVLLFHGIAEYPGEKLLDVLSGVLTNQMGMSDIRKEHIHVCHRLGTSRGKARPILVRLYTSEHRHLIWENKKCLKGTGITITEFLTHIRHRTFMDARKHFGMKSCWSVEGRIVIVTPDSKRHKIETPDELRALVSRFPKASGSDDDDDVATQSVEHTSRIVSPPGVVATPSRGKRKVRRRNN
ncbi:hypothetical protein PYW08_011984 [Mythimna loreyi]|uniref:Uncharacterized protein n=2 Tax=Mythimna loreyi TaxID=667449 RepID=A0ACC2QKY1_9NEOP|nr:hypothetical protein PYW08_011984 [Mythimna loreyi]